MQAAHANHIAGKVDNDSARMGNNSGYKARYIRSVRIRMQEQVFALQLVEHKSRSQYLNLNNWITR